MVWSGRGKRGGSLKQKTTRPPDDLFKRLPINTQLPRPQTPHTHAPLSPAPYLVALEGNQLGQHRLDEELVVRRLRARELGLVSLERGQLLHQGGDHELLGRGVQVLGLGHGVHGVELGLVPLGTEHRGNEALRVGLVGGGLHHVGLESWGVGVGGRGSGAKSKAPNLRVGGERTRPANALLAAPAAVQL